MNKFSNIWTQSNCLSKSQLFDYIKQKLDRDEVYLVESHLNDCSLCSDALDGLMDENIEMSENVLADIKSEIDEKIKQQHIIRKPELHVSHNTKNSMGSLESSPTIPSNNKYKWLAAASILLVVGLGGYSVYSYIKSQDQQLAQSKDSFNNKEADYNKPEDVNANEITTLRIDPSDSLEASSPNLSKEDKSMKSPAALKEDKNEKPVNVDIDPNLNRQPEIKGTPQITETSVAENEKEDIAGDNIISPSEGMSNYMEEKKAIAPVTDQLAKKKSSNIGLSNSKSNKLNQGSPQLSYPATQSNNSYNQTNDESAKNIEAIATSSKDLKSKQDDYENGMKLYNEGSYKKSIHYFESALKTASGIHKEDIQYQLALAYLKIGKQHKADKLFEILASSTKYKKEAAEKVQRSKK